MARVNSAIQSQNTVNPAGQVGSEPAPPGQEYTYSVRARGRRTSPEEFGGIVVRETPDGGIVRVEDVARVELGSVARQIMGTTVIGGMLAASVSGIFFIPAIFYVVEKLSGAGKEVPGILPQTPAPAQGD